MFRLIEFYGKAISILSVMQLFVKIGTEKHGRYFSILFKVIQIHKKKIIRNYFKIKV